MTGGGDCRQWYVQRWQGGQLSDSVAGRSQSRCAVCRLSGERHAGADYPEIRPINGYVDLDGQRFTIRVQVKTIDGYSAHADQDGLLRFVRGIHYQPRELRMVHGDDIAKRALQQRLQNTLPESGVVIAKVPPTLMMARHLGRAYYFQ